MRKIKNRNIDSRYNIFNEIDSKEVRKLVENVIKTEDRLKFEGTNNMISNCVRIIGSLDLNPSLENINPSVFPMIKEVYPFMVQALEFDIAYESQTEEKPCKLILRKSEEQKNETLEVLLGDVKIASFVTKEECDNGKWNTSKGKINSFLHGKLSGKNLLNLSYSIKRNYDSDLKFGEENEYAFEYKSSIDNKTVCNLLLNSRLIMLYNKKLNRNYKSFYEIYRTAFGRYTGSIYDYYKLDRIIGFSLLRKVYVYTISQLSITKRQTQIELLRTEFAKDIQTIVHSIMEIESPIVRVACCDTVLKSFTIGYYTEYEINKKGLLEKIVHQRNKEECMEAIKYIKNTYFALCKIFVIVENYLAEQAILINKKVVNGVRDLLGDGKIFSIGNKINHLEMQNEISNKGENSTLEDIQQKIDNNKRKLMKAENKINMDKSKVEKDIMSYIWNDIRTYKVDPTLLVRELVIFFQKKELKQNHIKEIPIKKNENDLKDDLKIENDLKNIRIQQHTEQYNLFRKEGIFYSIFPEEILGDMNRARDLSLDEYVENKQENELLKELYDASDDDFCYNWFCVLNEIVINKTKDLLFS